MKSDKKPDKYWPDTQFASLSKDSIFILSQFMNFDDYLLLSCFLIAFLYPQIHFDWWLQLIGIK